MVTKTLGSIKLLIWLYKNDRFKTRSTNVTIVVLYFRECKKISSSIKLDCVCYD